MLNVKSEIGRLKKVLLHRPGEELDNLVPANLDHLLFDDIPWLDLARIEHDAFAKLFKDLGIEVLYIEDLVAETLDQSKDIKAEFIKQFLDEGDVYSETLQQAVTEYLNSYSKTVDMVLKTMAGIRKKDLPTFAKRTLSDYIEDYPFITDPMPNLYFTRDPFAVIGNGVCINKMYTRIRNREAIYGEFLFKYHHQYGNGSIPIYYNRDFRSTIEGGDIMVLSDKILAVGISQRTHPAAIERLAKSLLYDHHTSYEKILAFDIPKTRAFMHLDTVFTQVDYDKFTIHHDLTHEIKVYELTKAGNYKLSINYIEKKLDEVLEFYLNRKITLIPCGDGDPIAGAREQWNDGANTLAIAPGEVIVYDRNRITNNALEKHGVKIHKISSSEIARGRGGPRCMSMAFIREDI